jgi:hypothetical protein
MKLYRGFPRLQNNYVVVLEINFILCTFDASLPTLTQEFSSQCCRPSLIKIFVLMQNFTYVQNSTINWRTVTAQVPSAAAAQSRFTFNNKFFSSKCPILPPACNHQKDERAQARTLLERFSFLLPCNKSYVNVSHKLNFVFLRFKG